MILVRELAFCQRKQPQESFLWKSTKDYPLQLCIKNNTHNRIESVFQKVSKKKDHSMFSISVEKIQNGTFEKKYRYVVI